MSLLFGCWLDDRPASLPGLQLRHAHSEPSNARIDVAINEHARVPADAGLEGVINFSALDEKNSEMVNKKIDEYRQSFRTAPIGRWQSVSVAFIVMHEDWEFYPDHTGKYTEYGPFGYPRRRTHFQWREYEELTILIGETKWENLEPVDKNEINGIDDGEPEDSIEEIEWTTVKYDFMVVTNEGGGEEIAMFQVGREYEGKACFYYCDPLAYRGPIEESE